MRNNTLITKEYTLTSLSPVHIGTGNILNPFEYFYDKKSNMIYFINESKWIAFLNEKKLMKKFTTRVMDIANVKIDSSKDKIGNNIWEWLLANKCTTEELCSVILRKARVIDGVDSKKSLKQITECVAMADGRPYIPGSSLKGAFRTAILAHILSQDKKLRDQYWNKVKKIDDNCKMDHTDRNLKKQYEKLAKELENQIFGELTKSKMRGLVVGDAICESNIDTAIMLREYSSTSEIMVAPHVKLLGMYWECIPAASKLNFQITIDTAMTKFLGISHPDDIVKMMKEFVQKGLDMRKGVFGKAFASEFKMADMADIILGGGTGFLTKTLLYSLAPDEKAGREIVRSYLAKCFRKADHLVADKAISPRTLHLVRDKKGYNIIGLCSIEDAKC